MDRALIMNELIELYGLQKNVRYAEFFGISEQNAYGWKRGNYNVYQVYQRVKDKISPEWLLSDGEEGTMLRNQPTGEEVDLEECKALLDKSLDNVREALVRVAEEQAISKQVLSQTDKVLELIRTAAKE